MTHYFLDSSFAQDLTLPTLSSMTVFTNSTLLPFQPPISGQTGAKSLRTSKLVPHVAVHLNYGMQVVWIANNYDSGRTGGKMGENRTSEPPNFGFKVHTAACESL